MGVSKTKTFASLLVIIAGLQSSGIIHLSQECLEFTKLLLGSGIAWGLRDAIGKQGGSI